VLLNKVLSVPQEKKCCMIVLIAAINTSASITDISDAITVFSNAFVKLNPQLQEQYTSQTTHTINTLPIRAQAKIAELSAKKKVAEREVKIAELKKQLQDAQLAVDEAERNQKRADKNLALLLLLQDPTVPKPGNPSEKVRQLIKQGVPMTRAAAEAAGKTLTVANQKLKKTQKQYDKLV